MNFFVLTTSEGNKVGGNQNDQDQDTDQFPGGSFHPNSNLICESSEGFNDIVVKIEAQTDAELETENEEGRVLLTLIYLA